jgi:2-succinyl-6-hydroxy-2,4-cyclohexadiene-1-carboxylate synthase
VSPARPPAWRTLAGPLPAEVAGSGHRITFLHGFTQTGRSWRAIAERVAALGYEVVIVDLPGHGDAASLRADLRRTADLLAATSGQGTYVGYSMGGRMGLHLALAYPHIVDRLALLGANPGIADDDERVARREADELLADRIREVGLATFLEEWKAQPIFAGWTPPPDDLADRLRNTAPGLAASLELCGTGAQLPLWERLVELNMPVLAMAGGLDTKFLPIAERIAATVPVGSFALVHDAGHAAHLQHPGQFATRLEIWLRDTAGLI